MTAGVEEKHDEASEKRRESSVGHVSFTQTVNQSARLVSSGSDPIKQALPFIADSIRVVVALTSSDRLTDDGRDTYTYEYLYQTGFGWNSVGSKAKGRPVH